MGWSIPLTSIIVAGCDAARRQDVARRWLETLRTAEEPNIPGHPTRGSALRRVPGGDAEARARPGASARGHEQARTLWLVRGDCHSRDRSAVFELRAHGRARRVS